MKVLSNHLVHLQEYAFCKGISRNIYQEKGVYIDSSLYLQEFEKLCLETKNENFGLHFGFFLNLNALGSLYETSLATTNIGQTILLWKDYSLENFPLVSFHKVIKQDKLFLILKSSIKNRFLRKQVLDTIFSFVYRELILMLKNREFNIILPYSDLSPYEDWFDCTLDSGNDFRFVFDKDILDKDINESNRVSIEVLLPKLLLVLKMDRYQSTSFSFLVRKMILNMSNPELPSLEQVAKQFLLTERTIQRKLKKEDNTYRSITNFIKKDLALYLSMDKHIRTKDMAYMLGYSSSSAFLHAKNNWSE